MSVKLPVGFDQLLNLAPGRHKSLPCSVGQIAAYLIGISVLVPNSCKLYTHPGIPAHIYFLWPGPGLGIGSRLWQCESPTAGRYLPIRFCQTLLRPLLALDRFSGSHSPGYPAGKSIQSQEGTEEC